MRRPILQTVVVLVLLCWASGAALGASFEARHFDGTGNHPGDLGAAGGNLMRLSDCLYPGDGTGAAMLGSPDRPNPRAASNAVVAQGGADLRSRLGLSDYVWLWGQFLDHDIGLTHVGSAYGTADIAVDPTDPMGPAPISFERSKYDPATGTAPDNPRQQVNEVTAFIDASQVYGSDQTRADALRTFGDGKLQVSSGELLPFNTGGLPNAGGTDAALFLAGDERANEQVGLTALHTVFVREHNRLADLISSSFSLLPADPMARDEEIYQIARKIVGAEVQIITYNEFLPAILGSEAPSAADFAYDPAVDPSIANEFSAALFRGHSLVSPQFLLADGNGFQVGNLALRDAFFTPEFFSSTPDNLDKLLRGFAAQTAQEFDPYVVDDLRNALFGPPGAGGLDLAAINMQRGRDHGLGDYNTIRAAYGLAPVAGFEDLTADPALLSQLHLLYGTVDNLDPWLGALLEAHSGNCGVGELVAAAWVDQFTRLRDGDRFFYFNDPFLWEQADLMRIIDLEGLRLADVIQANTGIATLQPNVFFADPLQPVPEPATVLLVGSGLVAIARRARRRKA